MIQALIAHSKTWFAWLLGIGGLIAGISWIPGVGTALGIGSSILTMIAPLVSGILEAFLWFWKTFLLPGLENILSNVSSIVTVVVMGSLLWVGFAARYEVRHIADHRALTHCQRNEKPAANENQDLTLPWPLSALRLF